MEGAALVYRQFVTDGQGLGAPPADGLLAKAVEEEGKKERGSYGFPLVLQRGAPKYRDALAFAHGILRQQKK